MLAFGVATFLAQLAALSLSVAIGWRVYEISGSPLALGFIGLAQFLPMFALSLPSGELCDRLHPRRILATGLLLQALCCAALVLAPGSTLWPYYAVMPLFGAARALTEPAEQALLPFVVPADRLSNAVAWNSTLWQVSVIAGPALGGWISIWGENVAYIASSLLFLTAAACVVRLDSRYAQQPKPKLPGRIQRIRDGLRFVRSHPLIPGAISLDLIAVLLGGATALLPIYARDVLHSGPAGLGLLRSAPALGACLTALIQTRRPVARHAGSTLFFSVAIFGVATIVFGLSTSFPLSLAALAVMGASDMVSVNIRASLIQLATPDAMRGRVAAVNALVIGASAELGEFESGLTAALVGTVPAVVLGGVGTLLVVPIWRRLFPALASVDSPCIPQDSRIDCLYEDA